MWFQWRTQKISWTTKKPNEIVLQENNTRRSLINQLRKSQAIFFEHVMTRLKIDHLVTTELIGRKHRRRKQCKKILDGLTERIGIE